MSTLMSHPAFPIPLFIQLVYRLRQTNARYDQIAYQCRRTQHPTYHAKRRAYRVGLRIDTSRARLDGHVFATSDQLLPVLDRSAERATTETETGSYLDAEDAYLPNPWPELEPKCLHDVVAQQVATCLSPLGLELSLNFDYSDACGLPFRGQVPGAPRWRPKPLPEDECELMEVMANELVPFEASCTYDPIRRCVRATHVSYGVTAPPRHLKRKLYDIGVDGRVSRRRKVSTLDDLWAWQSEAQRGRSGI